MTIKQIRTKAARLAFKVYCKMWVTHESRWPGYEQLVEQIAERLEGQSDVSPYELREIAREAMNRAGLRFQRLFKKAMKKGRAP
jgi:hypothetical protein